MAESLGSVIVGFAIVWIGLGLLGAAFMFATNLYEVGMVIFILAILGFFIALVGMILLDKESYERLGPLEREALERRR